MSRALQLWTSPPRLPLVEGTDLAAAAAIGSSSSGSDSLDAVQLYRQEMRDKVSQSTVEAPFFTPKEAEAAPQPLARRGGGGGSGGGRGAGSGSKAAAGPAPSKQPSKPDSKAKKVRTQGCLQCT